MSYPEDATARRGSAQTAFDAADQVQPSVANMLTRCERHIASHGPCSPEEIHAAWSAVGERVLLTSIRARVCQLHKLGRVIDSGERGIGESLRAKVVRWRLTTAEERAAFAAAKAEAEHV